MDNEPDEIWVTRDGRQIPVGELSEEHAKNIIRMILRAQRLELERFKKDILPMIEKEINVIFTDIETEKSEIDDAFKRAGADGKDISKG